MEEPHSTLSSVTPSSTQFPSYLRSLWNHNIVMKVTERSLSILNKYSCAQNCHPSPSQSPVTYDSSITPVFWVYLIPWGGGGAGLVSPQQVHTLLIQPCNLSPPLCAKGQSRRRQAHQWTTNTLQPLGIQYPANNRIYKNKYHPGNEDVPQSQNLPSTLDKESNKNQKEIIQSKTAA